MVVEEEALIGHGEELELLARWSHEARFYPSPDLLRSGLNYLEQMFDRNTHSAAREVMEQLEQAITRLSSHNRPHESPNEYSERQPPKLFRAIRPITVAKRKAPSSQQPSVSGAPDGDLFRDEPSHLAQRDHYQHLKAWPRDEMIQAPDPTADEPVVRQVGGDNYATQYISSTKQLLIACRVSAYNWAGAGGLGDLRPVHTWGPVIQVDVDKLPRASTLYDLEGGPHAVELWKEATEGKESAAQQIREMAERDREVLIHGVVPGEAVVRVWSVPEVIGVLLEHDPGLLDELKRRFVHEGKLWNDQDRRLLAAAGILEQIEEPAAPPEEDDGVPLTWVPRRGDKKKPRPRGL
jgi:hypothetical protein